MKTPVYDFLLQYAAQDPVRMHMPGHKGRLGAPALQQAAELDLTEIPGADSLFEASGILAESEANAASLYGTAYTFYSCAGSTLCIQTMLLLMKQEGRAVIAARNVHRAFLNACVLLDLTVQWVYPRESDGILSGTYAPEDFEAVLEQLHRPACIYVTSPDYLGRVADIGALAEICRKYHAKLLVDNAHGAHLAFLPWQGHPIQLGADYCCDSAHKMLSGLTGTAYLHVRSDIDTDAQRVRDAMAMFASTSPSYLMLASLDWCNRELASPLFREQLWEVIEYVQALKCHFSSRYVFVDGDPLHLTIDAAASGCAGTELAAYLEENGVIPEYADLYNVVLLCSAGSTKEDFCRLQQALEQFTPEQPPVTEKYALPRPETVCGIREAALAPQETIPMVESFGRICAAVKVPCPPAVPIVLSGERIDQNCISVCKGYGISEINVVQ
ncbi:aminotransferase class I/II-fold pyridoxal phosphate-dependent enzyme [uncultured Ruminococcus sp.]|uniref:aminotransferase class I/II-fold pyridoxal phosphate-dependent enzyme n=1 Tax=uncultured Ruminococcus sp. TaxID=165186 RepID=UPI0026150BF9|nr:aminotransferase class V-fold PLP-dependent enzyme [uncultured Ruminococcus sp.]